MAFIDHKARLLGAAAAIGAGLLLASPAAIAQDAPKGKIVIGNWDGYMPPDLLERFKAATGIEAELTVHATNEEVMGKVVAGGGKGYDVLFVSAPFAQALNALKLSAPIDHAKIPNLANLYPEGSQLKYDPGNTFSVPYAWGTTGLCYRTDLVEGTPDSWAALMTPPDALKGKITMLATDRWLLGAGFKSLGFSVNETDPAKIEQARDALIAAKKNLLSYDDTTFYSKLVSGEASLVHAWDGWCNYGIAENKDIKYVIPKEGTDLWTDTMVVTAASENKDAAHAFIDFVLSEDVGKWVTENIMYKTPNKKAMEALDPALLEQFPNMKMTPAELLAQEQMVDVGQAQKAYSRAVTEIMNAK